MVCKSCRLDQPTTEFYPESRNRSGLNSVCKTCVQARNKTYVYSTPKRQPSAEVKKRWVDSHREQRNAWLRSYVQRPEKKAKRREYLRTHPEVAATWTSRRRARKAGNGGLHTAQEWLDLCVRYGHVCLCCRRQKPLTRDHVIPLTLGGTDDIKNIQPLCRSCNARKGQKIIDYRLVAAS